MTITSGGKPMNQNGLKKVLLINAGFSALSGLALILGATALSGLFGEAHPWIFRGVGIGLLLFAGDILATCRSPRVSRSKALYFSYSDFGWVLGSIALLLAAPLSTVAAAIVAGVALIVLVFGVAQFRQIQGSSTHPA
jgi:hypothetical protein